MGSIVIRDIPHTYVILPCPGATTLVFVHGWLLSHVYWTPLLQHLSGEFQCLAYDLRGFGESSISGLSHPNPYTPASYAEDLDHLLTALNIERAWLIGHSLGGAIALWTASLYPERIQGVICLNSGGGIYLQEEFERFRRFGTQLVKYRAPWLTWIPGLEWSFSRFSVAKPLDPLWGKRRFLDFLRADETAALGALLESTTEAEVHHLPRLVSQLRQPTYFIGGDRDTIIEPQYVRHLASFHPSFEGTGANLLELSNCGHFAMLEQTTIVANFVRQWVTQRQRVPSYG
ncbi:MAG: alpha/beta fold hydrolase [Prochlorotrichaceae cyanobacterium]|jgi:pimeloyl-ACP methyl ester carboxylesterase